MIQGRGSPGKRIRMFTGHSAGYAEPEMFCDCRHSWDQQERIIHRDLDPALKGRIGPALIHVVRTKDVCEKQTIELSPFQQSGQASPIVQVGISLRTISRVTP